MAEARPWWSWLPPLAWSCPRCGTVTLSRDAAWRCERCSYRETDE